MSNESKVMRNEPLQTLYALKNELDLASYTLAMAGEDKLAGLIDNVLLPEVTEKIQYLQEVGESNA